MQNRESLLKYIANNQNYTILCHCYVGNLSRLLQTLSLSLSLTTGLEVVKVRSSAMQEACLEIPGAMTTIIGLQDVTLQAMIDAVLKDEEGSLSPSEKELCMGNHLFPKGIVVSGHVKLVQELTRRAESEGASVKPVRVSGAFHSKFMAPAVPKLQAVLKEVDLKMPIFPVYSNVTALPYGSVGEIRTGLALQVTRPVLWDRIVAGMIAEHLEGGAGEGEGPGKAEEVRFMEVGPGRQLKGMLKRINKSAYQQCNNLTV